MPTLTEISVRNIKPPISGQVTHYDESLAGFGLRVSQGGTKSFVLVHGENRQRTTIGRYPIISLADARTEAKRLLAENTLGKHRPKSIAFDDALTLFLKACAEKNRAKTVYDYTRLLNRHFKLGRTKLNEIATADISRKLGRIKATYERRYATVVIKVFFNWAYREGYVDVSPAGRLQAGQSKSRARVLSPDDLSKVWTAARDQAYPHGTIVQLLILTGQRRGEIANLRWPWINEKERTITLPEWVTKNKKEHTFPYDGMVSEILASITRRNTTDLLFPSKVSDDRPLSGWSKYKRELEDGVTGWTLHDLRRTYRSTHGEIGTPREIAERLINHAAGVTTDVEEIYDRWHYLPQMRAAVDQFDRHLSELLRPA